MAGAASQGAKMADAASQRPEMADDRGRDEAGGGGAAEKIPAGFVIRRATAADRPRLEPLVRAYIDFYREPQPGPERLDALLDLLAARPGALPEREVGVQFVAEKDGELHGFATVYLTYDTVVARRVAIMNDLFVAPDDRNVGLGRALIRECHSFARENDCAVLQWVTADDNATAQALYDKLGERTTWVTYSMAC